MYAFVTALAVYSLFFAPRRKAPPSAPPPVAVATPGAETPVPSDPPAIPDEPQADVQIALLLDTSSSMDGLIEQARTQLWEIVGELQTDDKDQQRVVTVALYHYGDRNGSIIKDSDLTTDLDAVSVRLHSLNTSGGKEHHPEAIARALSELDWNNDDKVEKVIVIAGNEGFAQGPVSAETAMTQASNQGVKVITIFCANGGASAAGLASWQRAAQLAGTGLETIDPDKRVAKIATPYDAQIVQKYKELEKTKLVFGDTAYRQQVDGYAQKSSSYMEQRSIADQADRAVTQARQVTRADLTAPSAKPECITGLSQEQLPSELQGLSKDEQLKEVENRRARRAQLEQEIKALSGQREAHLKKSSNRLGAPSLGSSVRAKLSNY
jgi:hypothetical protein